MDSAGQRQARVPFGSGKPRCRLAWGMLACWALAAGVAWTIAVSPATVSAAEAGPTALFYVRSPKALWDGLASLAPSEEAASAMRGFLEGANVGLDFERPLGVRVEFDETESFYYGVAIPTTDGAAVLERLALFLPRLRKANPDGSRDFDGGVVQARDGHLFFATNEDRLKLLRGAASLLPANAPAADILASFRPRTIPGFLRRGFLDGLEAELKKKLAEADNPNRSDLPDLPNLPLETADALRREMQRFKRNFERTFFRFVQENMRRLLLDTEEISVALRVRQGSLEIEWTQRLPADLPAARRFEARAAPSRFAAWDTKDTAFVLRESTVGSKTVWTTVFRDELSHALNNPADDAEPLREEYRTLMKWAEKYLTDGARDWACAVRRVEGRSVILFGLADPRLGEIGPILSKLQAEFMKDHADKIEFKPAAWKEGEFVVNVLVPIGLIGEDAKADEGFRRLYGAKPEFAVAFGPDRILAAFGEDCRGVLRTAIEETARPRETREPFLMRMEPVAEMRRSVTALDELGMLTEVHKARLKEMMSQAPDAEADAIEMRTHGDDLTQVVTIRFGHTISRTFALVVGAGIEQGIKQGIADAKAAAEDN